MNPWSAHTGRRRKQCGGVFGYTLCTAPPICPRGNTEGMSRRRSPASCTTLRDTCSTLRPRAFRPAAALLEYGADLPGGGPCMVVIGSRGRDKLTGLVLGSTGQNLITHAVWPVVVVQPGTARFANGRPDLTATRVEFLTSAE